MKYTLNVKDGYVFIEVNGKPAGAFKQDDPIIDLIIYLQKQADQTTPKEKDDTKVTITRVPIPSTVFNYLVTETRVTTRLE